MDLALNNLLSLICHKTQQTNQPKMRPRNLRVLRNRIYLQYDSENPVLEQWVMWNILHSNHSWVYLQSNMYCYFYNRLLSVVEIVVPVRLQIF